MKLIFSVHDEPPVCSVYRQRASGGESRWTGNTCRAWFVEAVDRGRNAELVGSMPSQQAGPAKVHVVASMQSVLGCDCPAVSRAWTSLVEMENAGGGVSTMELCRDGGGDADASGQPCLRWLPSSKLDGGPPQRCCDCADARALCSNFFRVNVPVRAWPMNACGCRVRGVWENLWQLVALVTMSCPRCSSPVTGP